MGRICWSPRKMVMQIAYGVSKCREARSATSRMASSPLLSGLQTQSQWPTPRKTARSLSCEATEPRFAGLSLNRAIVTRLPWPGRQTATRSDSAGTINCGSCRRTDRDFINSFRIGASPPGSAAAAGLQTGDSSYSCQETLSVANSCGLWMSVADNSGMPLMSRFH